jgi:voltage-gated potassium channel
LIGIMWAGVYAIEWSVSPGAFSVATGSFDPIYFSFVTLTTVGYGDVAPLTILSKRFAVFEAAMGSIYMAIIVALIVGRYLSPQADQE